MNQSILDSGSGAATGGIILLVEDNDVLRQVLAESLQMMSYTVYDAPNGELALALVDRIKEQIALVISDLVMPGMNALELYEALGLTQDDGKMLIITGYPMPNTGMSLVEKPGVRWASKPIGYDELQNLIGQMLAN